MSSKAKPSEGPQIRVQLNPRNNSRQPRRPYPCDSSSDEETPLAISTIRKRYTPRKASTPDKGASAAQAVSGKADWSIPPSDVLDNAKKNAKRSLEEVYTITEATHTTTTREQVYKKHAELLANMRDEDIDPQTLKLGHILPHEFRVLTMEDKQNIRMIARCVSPKLLSYFPSPVPDQDTFVETEERTFLPYESSIWFDEVPGKAEDLARRATDAQTREALQLLAHNSYSMLAYFREKEERQVHTLNSALERVHAFLDEKRSVGSICPSTCAKVKEGLFEVDEMGLKMRTEYLEELDEKIEYKESLAKRVKTV